jgi:hypothetical protein
MKDPRSKQKSEPLKYEPLSAAETTDAGSTLRQLLASILGQQDPKEGDLPVIA